MPHPSRRILLLALVLAVAACGGESTRPEPSRATTLEVVTPPPATGTAGTTLGTAPTFVVRDQNGNPMANVPVTVTTSAGSSVAGAPTTTGPGGATSVGAWTLAQAAGTNTLTVTVQGLTPLVLTVSGVAGPPVSLVVASGNGQVALAGRTVPQPVAFSAADIYGNPVAGSLLAVTVAAGGGTISTPTLDAQGRTVVTWTLGKSAVPQRLQANAGTLVATASATVGTDFDVDVRFAGPAMAAEYQAAFVAAAARLEGMIVGDLVDVTTGGALNLAEACQNSDLPTVNEIVDDLVIFAIARPIDGPGQVLGRAGPCLIRSPGSSELPVYGIMQFDTDDLARMASLGTLESVILHEMMHVVGLGSYWEFRGLLVDKDLPSVAFTGPAAREQCLAEGGGNVCGSSVPVENTGGAGTKNSHWRESVFNTELMTGYENARIVNGRAEPLPVSRMTAASLTDIGYFVNLDAADTFVVPVAASALMNRVAVDHGAFDEVLLPRHRISPNGRLTPILPEGR